MNQKPSPFKFLDAYQKEDQKIFFGREEEAQALYDVLSGSKHVLVYGPSGSGKTSLIECGLRNQFSDADWFAITIRKHNNITQSVYKAINQALHIKIPLNQDTGLPVDETLDFDQAIELLFEERFQPIYLLFDQFEELLLLGSQQEKIDFFTRLNQLIRQRVPVKVLLIMREEFIGYLSEFENLCPSIFINRFRLEKMRRSTVQMVIQSTLDATAYQTHFKVENSENLAKDILDKLPDDKKEIELTHVQVFLSELWGRANKLGDDGSLPILNTGLIQSKDNLESVLDNYLTEELSNLEIQYGTQVPLEILAAMVTEHGTKLQLNEEQIVETLQSNDIQFPQNLKILLEQLQLKRIIRPLRMDDKIYYEISHDLLSKAVRENLSEEIRLRQKANKVYNFYLDRKDLLSQKDLDHLRAFHTYKPYPAPLEQIIIQSKAHLAQLSANELLTQKKRNRTLLTLLTITLIGLICAVIFYQYANRQRKITIEEKQKVEQRNIDLQWSNATLKKIESRYAEAYQALDSLAIQLKNNPFEVNRIQDTIRSWKKVDSLTIAAANQLKAGFFESSVMLLEAAITESPDEQLKRKLQDYKNEIFEKLIEDIRFSPENKTKNYNLILRMKIKSSVVEIEQELKSG